MSSAPFLNLKRFSVHDGDGIRTTLFLKGCSLRCIWCHNPEGLSASPQLSYIAAKCIHCGECVRVCASGAQVFEKGKHRYQRENCAYCGKCEEMCLGEALHFYGRRITPEEILPKLLEDEAFYRESGGGVTISGGECLLYPEFCTELLKLLKERGISTAVDTCGFVPRAALELVMPYTDIFWYDVKARSPEVHQRCTGQDNVLIMENLLYLVAQKQSVEIRIPFVPGWNAGEIPKIAELLAGLPTVTGVRVLPYHNLAGSKYLNLGMVHELPVDIPTEEQLKSAELCLEQAGLKVLK